MPEIDEAKTVASLLSSWRKEAESYLSQVDEAQRKGLPFDCMLGMADGIKFCRLQLAKAFGDRAVCSLSVGDCVEKTGGDYTFEGAVVSVFEKSSGQVRLVVEDDRGVLHIYSERNLLKKNLPFERNRALIEAEK